MMFAKVKSPNFIDSLQLELTRPLETSLKAVLKDDNGCICSVMQETPVRDNKLVWNGLSSLPYGVYTLELVDGEDEMKLDLVKRV